MYYTIYDISKYMARYIKENNLDYTDVKKEGLLITKPPAKYEHSRNIIKITKDFVYGYSEDLKYSEYYEEYKTITEEGIYYRENVVLEMELFGNYVNINIKDKIKKAYPEPFTKGIFLGEITIFGGELYFNFLRLFVTSATYNSDAREGPFNYTEHTAVTLKNTMFIFFVKCCCLIKKYSSSL